MDAAERGLFWGFVVVMVVATVVSTQHVHHVYKCEKAGGQIKLVDGHKKCVEVTYKIIKLN